MDLRKMTAEELLDRIMYTQRGHMVGILERGELRAEILRRLASENEKD